MTEFDTPQSRNEALLQNILGADNPVEEPQSRNEAILQAILGYDVPVPEVPESRIEDLLLQIKEKGIGGVTAEPIIITQNGEYTAEQGKAYTPVTVNVANKWAALVNGSITALTADDLEGISAIRDYAFAKCVSLSSIEIPNTVLTLGAAAFSDCAALASVKLSESITIIANATFQLCSSLQSIILPASISSLMYQVFRGCAALSSVTVLRTVPPYIKSDTFLDVPADCAIYVPAESVAAYKAAQYWSDRAAYIQAIPTGG